MLAEKKWINADPKDAKIVFLTYCMYKLSENKTTVLTKSQRGGENYTQTGTNTKWRSLTFMLKYLPTLDHGALLNTKTILIEISFQ